MKSLLAEIYMLSQILEFTNSNLKKSLIKPSLNMYDIFFFVKLSCLLSGEFISVVYYSPF